MIDGEFAGSLSEAASDDNTEALLEMAGHGQPDPTEVPEEAPAEEAPEVSEAPEAPAPDTRYVAMEAQVAAMAQQIQTLTSVLTQQVAPPEVAAAPAEEPPDLATAPADEYVRYHARQANKELEAKLDKLVESLAPIQRRERFVGAYHEAAVELDVDPRTMSGKVAELMETDDDIRALADQNPKAAARLALKMAQQAAIAARPAPAPRPAPPSRPAARPSSASSPRRIAGAAVPKSWGEAIQQTLREQGVPEGSHYTFTTQGNAPEGIN